MSPALRSLCPDLPPEARGRLQSMMTTAHYPAGQVLFKTGQAHAGLCAVESGMLEVLIEDHVVARVGPGEWVGEVSLLDPGPASATVRATQDSTALVLSPTCLARLTRDDPAIARAVVRALSVSLARRLRASSDRILAQGQGQGVDTSTPSTTGRGWFGNLLSRLGGGSQ